MIKEINMEFQILTENFETVKSDMLIIPLFEDAVKIPDNPPVLSAKQITDVNVFLERSHYKAKLNQDFIVPIENAQFPGIGFIGAGKISAWNLEHARQIAGTSVKILQRQLGKTMAFFWPGEYPMPGYPEMFLPEMVAAMITAEFHLKELKKEEEDEVILDIEQVTFLLQNPEIVKKEDIVTGIALGEAINNTRRLAELPSNILTPADFGEEVKQLAKKHQWGLEILDQQLLRKMEMNALLAVAQGSENPPFLLVASLSHPAARKTVALVGKGVTFDSGGISLKPSKNMEEMKYDMCGAAAVLGTLQAVSLTRLPVNVIAVMPLVENMPSGTAIRPGDIVKSYSGKTVEIINTDAEGRLILADALSYVEKRYTPDMIVDLATLTGAVIVALGHLAAGVLTTDENMLESLQEAANISGERIWQLPLWDDYDELMKSRIADIRNISTKSGAGTITATAFLKKFVEKTPWAHIDIAGTAWDMPEKSYRPAGATGFGVRLLWHWLKILTTRE
jgi:leucyl aminopeptidase